MTREWIEEGEWEGEEGRKRRKAPGREEIVKGWRMAARIDRIQRRMNIERIKKANVREKAYS